jgi:hypothetical protein
MPASTRERIVAAAAALLGDGQREAVSAGGQAPAVHRVFGDKQRTPAGRGLMSQWLDRIAAGR